MPGTRASSYSSSVAPASTPAIAMRGRSSCCGAASPSICRRIIWLHVGCGSFPGIDPTEHAEGLSLLAHDHLAPAELRARAIGADAIPLATLPIGGYDARLARRPLPPLIKAYLRVGTELGDGVFVMMPVARIATRYAQRFEVAA